MCFVWLLPLAPCSMLFYDSIRPRQHMRRNGEADLLRRFEIDYQFKPRRLLHGQIGGFSPVQNLVDINSGTPELIDADRSVSHETTCLSSMPVRVYRRQLTVHS